MNVDPVNKTIFCESLIRTFNQKQKIRSRTISSNLSKARLIIREPESRGFWLTHLATFNVLG